MDMPVSERRLNIRYINEHLDKIKEAQQEREVITANKPKIQRPPSVAAQKEAPKATYTSTVKSKK